MSELATIILKPKKERKVRNFYPWIQRGEVVRVEGDVEDGDLARLVSSTGEFLAVGTYNSQSRFRFRVLSLEEELIDEAFFERRFRSAVTARDLLVAGTNARRIVYSEADRLPGLIIDEYDGHLVVQVRSKGMEKLKSVWLPALVAATGAKSVYEKSEMAGRKEEGLEPTSGQLIGETPDEIEIEEDGLRMTALIKNGLKTGFYLDQRNTRRLFAQRLLEGDRVLDGFCYTGAFSMHAARAGASVVGIDLHEKALATARKDFEANGLSGEFIEANLFEWLEGNEGEKFDWIVLDPPAISKTSKTRDALKWAVWKLVHNALPHLNPGGRIIACSCSYQLIQKELIEICRLAASDRHVRLFLEDMTYQDLDHPAPIQFPEALYLKCAWLRLG
ncbi:MAG: class I SAM-dependent rRNA methyltransferase [Armatimonadetes bacterium]|nr:class I SAM-dependent rRNA methyltransferase [Armatimonadota bacterium]